MRVESADASKRITLGYSRVSSHDQKDDLMRQKEELQLFCAQRGWSFEIIEDLGSGMNYRKKKSHRIDKSVIIGGDREIGIDAQRSSLTFQGRIDFYNL